MLFYQTPATFLVVLKQKAHSVSLLLLCLDMCLVSEGDCAANSLSVVSAKEHSVVFTR